ncbi:OmpA family protein [Desulfobacula toluolica]|uniref:Predicted outer membrane protein, OmpA/MotB domain n=1 Tax=Desulfobacula toluolica (strain DSM 7467 / Tol2) TaxID=651182 RepID=K0NDY4_DESTT|nr:OmpA family protein [Desulfobacula toluolica]CCK79141.1 predicted outer membrane protein, OmpA/MotB domain [Desulfobacula toluolica Tol2]
MKVFSMKIIPLLLGTLFLFGCYARQQVHSIPDFTATQFDSNEYASAVDNFLIIMDASSSMDDDYMGNKKFIIALEIINRLNLTLPELLQNGGLRSFGHDKAVSEKNTVLFYGMEPYSTKALKEKLNLIKTSGGTSPMHSALTEAGQDLNGVSGKTAMVIISDGQEAYGMGHSITLAAAQALKNQLGPGLCYYPVIIGDNNKGTDLMEKISGMGECGFATNADTLLTGDGMARFVKDVFLTQKTIRPMAPKDSDNDGVTDNMDKCPGTPHGTMVNADGCPPVTQKPAPAITETLNAQGAWVIDEAYFDFDKAVVKPSAFEFLDNIAEFLKNNPEVFININGHTDNIGTKAYNDVLSLRRAEAVKTYLTNKGIEKNRLACQGFAFSKPVASNKTDKGRALNRRVEIYPVK